MCVCVRNTVKCVCHKDMHKCACFCASVCGWVLVCIPVYMHECVNMFEGGEGSREEDGGVLRL